MIHIERLKIFCLLLTICRKKWDESSFSIVRVELERTADCCGPASQMPTEPIIIIVDGLWL